MLLKAGHNIRTLTNSPDREHDFGDSVEVHAFNFDDIDKLTDSLRGAEVFYNTYWVRFNHSDFKHSIAVENTLKLFEAAKNAGVKRVVHTSILNPDENSPLEYYSGKGRLERALKESGLSYAILRPTVLFGPEDILLNNIAWTIRKFPFFPMFGNGKYKIQPIHVQDFANLMLKYGQTTDNIEIDATGPETFTYKELAKAVGEAIGVKTRCLGVPAFIGLIGAWITGKFVGDVVVTREEIKGLMDGLLYADSPAQGEIVLTEWAKENADTLGVKYHSELARRKNRKNSYTECK